MAYLRKIYVRHCACGRKATHELINLTNDVIRSSCSRCAKRDLKQLLEAEKRQHQLRFVDPVR